MRNFTQTLVASLFLSMLALSVTAQKTLPQPNAASATARMRCGSMEALEHYFTQNPAAREQYQRNLEEGKQLAAAAAATSANKINAPSGVNGTQGTQAIVTIPVVVHLVLSHADMAKVTKADVEWQINKLNEDYAGMNADSTNATNFYGIRGHSQIRFCLARQDANGNPTDGINRVYSTITDFNSGDVGKIKHANSCGADSWDPSKYLNIWVSRSVSLLGIATFPQTGPPDEQGVALALDGFSNNPAYVNPFFALGRTLVHEAGHYFGLYHIWGDDGTGCGTDDFRQITGSCVLPGSLLLGDTPNQAGNTNGCPNGVKTDGCSTTSPGVNYQNFMDYTDDACYSMFTNQQVARAEYVLNNCRTSLLSSNACTPVTLFTNDAAAQILSPGNSCYPGGSTVTTFCQNSSFSAQIVLRNLGTTNLTSVKVNAMVGNGPVTTFNWTGNLPPYETALVTVTGINAGTTAGTVPLKLYTSDPNGVPDQRVSNDTATFNVTVNSSGVGLPSVTEGFESTTFPPTNWTVINPDAGSLTWARNTNARNSGNASASISYRNYTNIGHLDYLVAPGVNVQNADSIIIDFARAYKRYATAANSDTLAIQLATGCGATSFSITAWRKGGDDLSTSPGAHNGNWVPGTGEWAREYVNVRSLVPAGTATLTTSFTGKNGNGQNLYLDDINIRAVFLKNLDARMDGIIAPLAKQCVATFRPAVRIFNAGKDTIRTLQIIYRITGPSAFTLQDTVNFSGTLALQQTTVVQLKQVTLPNPGVYNFRAWTRLPNNGTDENTLNDSTATLSFRLLSTTPAPLFEGFENSLFPPPNWVRVNQDFSGTWFRTTAASIQGVASAAMDNYNYNAGGTNDDLESPWVTYSGIDSAYLTFQVAHGSYYYPGSTGIPLDTLQVLVSKDCGQTFTTVYSKWGEDLQTVNNPNEPRTTQFVPTNSQWRKETVNLTQLLGSSGGIQVVFRAKGNFGNSILLDDINITTKTLPEKLKQQGYLIAPNPFNGSFNIQHHVPPTNLRGIQITNAAGQTVYVQNFSGNAGTNIHINMTTRAVGMYVVKMIYDNKVITERVIKRN